MPSSLDDLQDDLQGALQADKAQVDARLDAVLVGGAERLRQAMRYSVLAGGKRLRPILCLWAGDCWQAPRSAARLDVACAVELIHTYSLIHDDLPCMDDDELRRGRATCHVEFDEATAILAGDALLNLGYEVLGNADLEPAVLQACLRVLTDAASHRKLVGGQMWDLESETSQGDPDRLRAIHEAKTAALIGASLQMGALLAGFGFVEEEGETLRQAGLHLGMAFQIVDDVLDVTRDSGQLGKSAGKDRAAGKLTYVALYGVERSKSMAEEHISAAHALMGSWPRPQRLQALARYFGARLN